MQSLKAQPPSAKEIVARDPVTGEEIGRLPVTGATEVEEAVFRARESQPAWAAVSFKERGKLLLKAREIALDETEEIARIIARETGKPVAEAISMEIVPTLDLMHYFAHQTESLLKTQ
jgi:succinate-semialdehyde dehydrogenase/glutarate-semialdehyde dehydrogenase